MRGEYPAFFDERNVLARCVEGFRDDMKAIYERYDADLKGLERYKGSTGYDEEKTKLDAKLKEKTDAIREKYHSRFSAIGPDLKRKVGHVGLKAPTNEQLNLLTLMKLQDTISVDSLTLAIRTLANSPLALEALHSIAKEKGQRCWPLGDEYHRRLCSLAAANEICDTLASRIAAFLHYVERPGDFRRYVNDPTVPTYLISFDKDFDTVKECFVAFAGIDSEECDAFFDFIAEKDMTSHVITMTDRALAVDAREQEGADPLAGSNENSDESQNAETNEYVPTSGSAIAPYLRYQAELADKERKEKRAVEKYEDEVDTKDMPPAQFAHYVRTQLAPAGGVMLKATEPELPLRFGADRKDGN